jgi:Flp pilus assembly protein TadB
MYRSAESSATAATGAGAQPRPRSASKIIDFALAQVVAPSSTTLGGAFPQLSTSFDSEFDLNTEMMAHKGAFRDALTLRDEQLLMRLKQKQRELKQMEAALLKKQEEYLLIKVHALIAVLASTSASGVSFVLTRSLCAVIVILACLVVSWTRNTERARGAQEEAT